MQVKNSSGEDTREGVEVIAIDATSSLHVDTWADLNLVHRQPLSDALLMRGFDRSARGLQVVGCAVNRCQQGVLNHAAGELG